MSDLLLEHRRPRAHLGRLLVLFTGSAADERALDTALQLAECSGASLQAVLLQGEFRAYSIIPGELERLKEAWQARLAEQAFALCERALTAGSRLPLELVEGNGKGWLDLWISGDRFALVVLAHPRRPLRRLMPPRLDARVRRSTTCPIVVVK
jgi:nucleotide-binding universal stress UspA family protein